MMNELTAKARIVFMGTPQFAVPSLKGLIEQGNAQGWEVVGVYTQPDRRAGRGKKLVASPVKQVALDHGIPVFQPETMRPKFDRGGNEAAKELDALAPDLVVVAAYGMILPMPVLITPNFGCINVHASLLPAYRGASPINAAILNGDQETGNSIMMMEEGLDTGPVLAQASEPIHSTDTAIELTARLSDHGAVLLVETLPEWLAGGIYPIPQDELAGEPTLCRIIKKSQGKIDWSRNADHIERMARAYHPWPSAFTTWIDAPFKVIQASVESGTARPGEVVSTENGIAVGCGQDLLLLHTVQPAGKRPMDIQSFLNGTTDFVGSQLG